LVRDVEEEHAHDLEVVDRARTFELLELFLDRRPPLLDVVGGVLDSDPAGQAIFGDPFRRDLRYSEPSEEDRRMKLFDGLHAEAAFFERGKLTVIFEDVVRPDTLHDLDRLDDVLVPLLVDVRRTRGFELLRHPTRSDAYVDPSARKVVPGTDLGRQHT